MNAKPKPLYRLLGGAVLAGSVALAWLIMDVSAFLERPITVPEEGLIVSIEPGVSMTGLANSLAERGVVDRPRYLIGLARWRNVAADIQAGEYRLEQGMTPPELLSLWVAGKVVQYPLTLVEGWTFAQFVAAVRQHDKLVHTLDGRSPAEIMAAIGAPGEHPEGRFYPDTYYFPRGTTDVEVMQRAYRAMQARLQEEWEARAAGLPYSSPYQALVLASIVEKETAVPSERAQIAGVMVRRLEKGMRLQVDPTVIYGLGAEFDGNLRRRHLQQDTPYNTYRHGGLPPTPIASPSGASIHAALHPAPGDALYYVSRGDGSHHFSATLEEHNDAVIRYQIKGQARPSSSHPTGRVSSRDAAGRTQTS